MAQRKQPPQNPPPVQKLRLRYAKRGAARFTSHRDFSRALERALRRVEVPMAYSSGFHPHPRISYANPAPTSAASEAEFVELGLAEHCDPQKIIEALNESLPTGFEILDAADAVKASMNDLLHASDWQLAFSDADPAKLAAAVERLMGEEHFEVERMTKSGMRTFDVREAILSAETDETVLRVRLKHLAPLVRPDDVATALRMIEPELPSLALFTRTTQGILDDGEIRDPLRP